VLAYAKIFMASAATSLSLAAVVIVGALGQTIPTTAGDGGRTRTDRRPMQAPMSLAGRRTASRSPSETAGGRELAITDLRPESRP
jgi:hypothetical protein